MGKMFNKYHTLLRNKLWAQTHDPIIKMWYVKIHESISDRVIMELDLHLNITREEENDLYRLDYLASSIDRQLLGPFYLYKVGGKLRSPDNKIFINIFDPRVRESIDIDEKRIYEIFNEVNNDIKGILDKIKALCDRLDLDDDLRNVLRNLLYLHIISYFFEFLWIKHGGPQTIADTRIPTHSIFTHNSAVASVTNWYSENKFKGYIVRIDLGGIHSFIANSRKLRDIWASSYLASGLVWMAISPLVFLLGPDIVLSPSLSLNPVYGYTLLRWMEWLDSDDEVYASLKDLVKYNGENRVFKKLACMIGDKDPPEYSIQPGIFTLILPERRVIKEAYRFLEGLRRALGKESLLETPPFKILLSDEVKKFMEDEEGDEREWIRSFIYLVIKNGWEKIYKSYLLDKPLKEVMKEFLSPFSKESASHNIEIDDNGLSTKYIENYMKSYRRTPPFIVRIYVGLVDEAYGKLRSFEEYLSGVAGKKFDDVFIKGFLDHLLIEFISEEVEKDRYLNFSFRDIPYTASVTDLDGSEGGITPFTQEVFKYSVCKEAGDFASHYKLLAVAGSGDGNHRYILRLETARTPPGFKYCTSCGELPAILHVEVEHVFLKDGEKLCPICLFKRVVGRNPSTLVKTIFGLGKDFTVKSGWPGIFASTSALANHDYLEFLTRLSKDFQDIFDDDFSEYLLKDQHGEALNSPQQLKKDIEYCVRHGAEGKPCSGEEVYCLQLYHVNPEVDGMFLSEATYRDRWRRFTNSVYEKLCDEGVFLGEESVAAPSIKIYYGMYVTDGDRMGKLLSGDLYKAKTIPKKHFRDVSCFKARNREVDISHIDYDEVRFYIEYVDNVLYLRDRRVRKLYKEILNKWFDEIMKMPSGGGDDNGIWLDMEKYVDIAYKVYTSLKKQYPDFEPKLLQMIAVLLGLYLFKPVVYKGGRFRLQYKPRYIPSMAYLTLISRSLITSILNDIILVSDMRGVVVYAGGDDLLAVLPLVRFEYKDDGERRRIIFKDNVLEGIKSIRKFYSLGVDEVFGFARIGEHYLIPMFIGHGRSATLMITHYRTPLKMAIEYSKTILDEIAKEDSKWLYNAFDGKDRFIQVRDGLVIGVMHSGYPRYVKLPNMIFINDKVSRDKVIPTLDIVKHIFNRIKWVDNEGYSTCKLSKSILKDVDKDVVAENIESKDENLNPWVQSYLWMLIKNIYIDRNIEDKRIGDCDRLRGDLVAWLRKGDGIIDCGEKAEKTILRTFLPLSIIKSIDMLRVGWREA